MSTPRNFRVQLAQRIAALVAVSVASTAVGASSGGCSSVGTSCGEGAGTSPSTQCFPWPEEDGSASSTTGAGGAGGASGAGGGAAVPCPSEADAKARFQGSGVVSVDSPGTFQTNSQCCYEVTITGLCEGRPFLVKAAPVTAALAPSTSPKDWHDEGLLPDRSSLSPDERSALATMWQRAGLMEHASVASFSRFALELMAAGAPADLVEATHRAALDEVRHARLCFGLASAYAGETVAPGGMPLGRAVELSTDLVDLAIRTWNEGCVGETISACLAAERLAAAEDVAARAALAVIAEDEARHAELAFRAVAWAIQVGGERVRAAVTVAASQAHLAAPESSPISDERAPLTTHGQLGKRETRAAVARALREVIAPSARALLQGGFKTTDWQAEGGKGAASLPRAQTAS